MNDREPDENDVMPEPLLRAAIDALPAEIDPGRDLWPGVASRLTRRRRISRIVLAAAAALALGAAVWRFSPALAPARPSEGAQVSEIAQVAAPEARPATGGPRLAAYSEGERALTEIRDELVREIEAKQDRLPPETRDLVFENLRTIDRALSEIEAALELTPGDAELGRTYIAYRERQIGLLRQANRAASRL